MGLTHLDAGVIIGALDADDAHHDVATTLLTQCRLTGDRIAMSASAVAEILVAPHRHSPEAVRLIDELIDRLPIEVVPVSRNIARLASSIRADHTCLRLPDALVIASAIDQRADRLVTTDHRWPNTIDATAAVVVERI
jgi:predicted nucleic acid-binding protein